MLKQLFSVLYNFFLDSLKKNQRISNTQDEQPYIQKARHRSLINKYWSKVFYMISRQCKS